MTPPRLGAATVVAAAAIALSCAATPARAQTQVAPPGPPTTFPPIILPPSTSLPPPPPIPSMAPNSRPDSGTATGAVARNAGAIAPSPPVRPTRAAEGAVAPGPVAPSDFAILGVRLGMDRAAAEAALRAARPELGVRASPSGPGAGTVLVGVRQRPAPLPRAEEAVLVFLSADGRVWQVLRGREYPANAPLTQGALAEALRSQYGVPPALANDPNLPFPVRLELHFAPGGHELSPQSSLCLPSPAANYSVGLVLGAEFNAVGFAPWATSVEGCGISLRVWSVAAADPNPDRLSRTVIQQLMDHEALGRAVAAVEAARQAEAERARRAVLEAARANRPNL